MQVRRQICHVAATLAQTLAGLSATWPELLSNAIALTQQPQDRSQQEVGLFLLARIGEYAHASLRPAAEQIFAALGNSLSNAGSQQSADSRTFMLDATSNFLLALEPAQLPACKPLIQPMLTCLESLLANGDEVAAREAIESLIDLAVDPGVLENLGDGLAVSSPCLQSKGTCAQVQ